MYFLLLLYYSDAKESCLAAHVACYVATVDKSRPNTIVFHSTTAGYNSRVFEYCVFDNILNVVTNTRVSAIFTQKKVKKKVNKKKKLIKKKKN